MRDEPLARIRRIGFQTIVRREFGRIIRIWGQTLVPPAVTAALYFVIFGSLIGRRIGQMGGVDYMQYIAPGLIMMAVISNSYGNVVSSFFGAKFGKHIEELLVAPLPNWLIVLGYVAGGLVRGLLVGAVVTVVTLFFTHVPVAHPLLVAGSGLGPGTACECGDPGDCGLRIADCGLRKTRLHAKARRGRRRRKGRDCGLRNGGGMRLDLRSQI